MIYIIEEYLVQILYVFILLLEIYGAAVIIYSATFVFWYFARTSKDGKYVRLTLAKYLSFGLEIFLGAEILRTVISREMEEILVLAAIVALRAIMALLIHWEVKQEKV